MIGCPLSRLCTITRPPLKLPAGEAGPALDLFGPSFGLVDPLANEARTILESHSSGFATSQEFRDSVVNQNEFFQIQHYPNSGGFTVQHLLQFTQVFSFDVTTQLENDVSIRDPQDFEHVVRPDTSFARP